MLVFILIAEGRTPIGGSSFLAASDDPNMYPFRATIFNLHRMHEMQTIVTDVHGVRQSVCHTAYSVVRAVCAVHSLQSLPNYFSFLLTLL